MTVETDITAERVREFMESGRKWEIGEPRDKHSLENGDIVFYELMSVKAMPDILWKIVKLIMRDAGNKSLVWRVVPNIEHSYEEYMSRLYMRYAFKEAV